MSAREDLELLEGACDLHVHAHPDVLPRIGDEVEIALAAKEKRMKAILFKSAYSPNAARVKYVNKSVPEVRSFGGVVLNPPQGGLNPSAVEVAIKLGGKAVWMPTVFSDAHIRYLRSSNVLMPYQRMAKTTRLPEKGLRILDGEGKLVSEVREILGMVADANILLCTGHLSKEEIFVLVDEAQRSGVKKILVTHPNNVVPNLSLEDHAALARKGANLELCFIVTTPLWRNCGIEDIIEVINRAGPERCVLATDFGQLHHPVPPEGLRMFLRSLFEMGVRYEDLERMVKANPSRLLDLD